MPMNRLVTLLLSLLGAFACGALILALAGYDPLEAYSALLVGAFGSKNAIANTLAKSTPLIFTGLAVAVAFRGGLFNIGAEGQLYMGAMAAALVGVYATGLPGLLQAALALLAAGVVGALWAGIAGYMKVKFRAHEVIVTIMLNYIAISLTNYLVNYPFKAEGSVPRTDAIPAGMQLTKLMPPNQVTTGIFIAILACIIMYWMFNRTVYGYEIRAIGLNEDAARTGGISIGKRVVLTMFLSGFIAALAGAVEVLGVHKYFVAGFSPGYGYDGIAVAVLAGNHPLGVIISALLFGSLRSGSMNLDRQTDVPTDVVVMIQALVIIFVAIPWVIRKVKLMRKRGDSVGSQS
jgi:simple sugar transport system permease protein